MTSRLPWVGLGVAAAAVVLMAAIQVPPATLHGPKRGGTATTLNWAGAAAAGSPGDFSRVSASWRVPRVTCSPGETSYSIAWVGLDGFNSSTVEQAGTESSCYAGFPRYDAWYEVYPNAPVFLNVRVRPGDEVDASVGYAKGSFTLHLAVSGRTFDTSVADSGGAARSSAEAIVEAPLDARGNILQFARISPVTFDGVSVAGRGGNRLQSVDMVTSSGSVVAATTRDGDAFTVTER